MCVLDVQETLLLYIIDEKHYFNPIRSRFVVLVPLPFSSPSLFLPPLIQNIKTLFNENPDIFRLCFHISFITPTLFASILSDIRYLLKYTQKGREQLKCVFKNKKMSGFFYEKCFYLSELKRKRELR